MDDSEEDEQSESASDQGGQQTSTAKGSRSFGNQAMEEDSRVMLQQLKKASSADVEKGLHVRKQLVSGMLLFHNAVPEPTVLLSVFLGYAARSQNTVTEMHVKPQLASISESTDFGGVRPTFAESNLATKHSGILEPESYRTVGNNRFA